MLFCTGYCDLSTTLRCLRQLECEHINCLRISDQYFNQDNLELCRTSLETKKGGAKRVNESKVGVSRVSAIVCSQQLTTNIRTYPKLSSIHNIVSAKNVSTAPQASTLVYFMTTKWIACVDGQRALLTYSACVRI